MPDFRNRYPLGWGDSQIGSYIGEDLPNIRGVFKPRSGADGIDTDDKTQTGGAFNKHIWYNGKSCATGAQNYDIIWYEFNANSSNNIYKDNTRIHPLSIVMNYCIRY